MSGRLLRSVMGLGRTPTGGETEATDAAAPIVAPPAAAAAPSPAPTPPPAPTPAPAAAPPPPPPAPAPMISSDLLNFIGQQSEELRGGCETIVRKIEETASLNRDLAMLFAHFDRIRVDFERTQIDLIQTKSLLVAEQKANGTAQTHLRTATEQLERRSSDLLSLQVENEHLTKTIEGLTGELESASHELSEERKLSPTLRQELATERARLAAVYRSSETLTEEVRRNDATISRLQNDLVGARDRIAVLEQEGKAHDIAANEQLQTNAKLNRSLDDAQAELAASREKIKSLESAVAAQTLEVERIRGMWKEETDGRRMEVSALSSRGDGLSSRLEATEQLLADARQQLQIKSDALRVEERRVQEAANATSTLEMKLQNADQRMAETRDRLQKAELSNVSLVERSQALVKAYKARELDAEQAHQKLDAALAKIAADTARFDAERDRLLASNIDFAQQIEKLKGEKALLEGALGAARTVGRPSAVTPLAMAPGRGVNANEPDDEQPSMVANLPSSADRPAMRAKGLI